MSNRCATERGRARRVATTDRPVGARSCSCGLLVRDGKTSLVGRRHTGPLLVQRPFHPERRRCHVYIVHPPGGVVGGDRPRARSHASAQARMHSSRRLPRRSSIAVSEASGAIQTQELRSSHDATLEWLPQESIFYRDALVRAATPSVKLDGRNSRFIGWEIPCLGLPARGEPFGR